MKIKSVMLLSSLAFAFAQAQEEPVSADAVQKVLVEKCKTSLSFLEKSIPSNAVAAKATLAEAMGTSRELDFVFSNDPLSPDVATLAKTCDIYVNLVQMQAESQSLRNHIDANWEKRIATARAIEGIQEKINQARSGQVSNLQENFSAQKAAMDDLQRALDEERAKAEQRQKDAMNKLNALQSQMIQVTKDARGIILSMSDILFDVGKASLMNDLKTSLAKVAGILSVYQQFKVSIEGHTDNTGSEEFNMKLSEQRATNVMNFLVEQGIKADRLTAKGYGMTMPVADNSTKEGRQKNRRVDLVIQDQALQQ